jgi:phosphohistidine phosphatase SixA
VIIPAAPAQTVFVVRHAERTGDPDPPLNPAGRQRAQALSRLLADAGVYYFFTSDTIRARETAEPLAKRAGRPIEVIGQTEIDKLVARVLENKDRGKATLVVGHRSTAPRIVEKLAGERDGPVIPALRSDEHDRLLVVTLTSAGASVVTLRYCQ